jgi:GDP-4-dehydro-6-deoxy-D-mannose reductase
MKKLAVFGISGFSGRHFVRLMLDFAPQEVCEIHGFGRDLNASASPPLYHFAGDARDEASVAAFLRQVAPTHIVNLVGVFQAGTFMDLLATNVGVSHTICETVVQSGLRPEKILLIGSAAEYGAPDQNPVSERSVTRPVSPYGLSKLYQTKLADFYFQNHRLQIVIARTFNLLGQGMLPILSIGSFMRQIEKLPEGGTIKVGNLDTSRDYLPIEDAVRQYWRLLMLGKPGEVYNVCSGKPRTMRSILDDLISRSGKRLAVEIDPGRFKAAEIDMIYGDPCKYQALLG